MAGPPLRVESLATAKRHAVYRLAPGLLLVFKPRGHREEEHAHAHRQRLRVLSGALVVRTARGSATVRAGDRPLTIAAGRPHATRALRDTWLVAESVDTRPSRDATRDERIDRPREKKPGHPE